MNSNAMIKKCHDILIDILELLRRDSFSEIVDLYYKNDKKKLKILDRLRRNKIAYIAGLSGISADERYWKFHFNKIFARGACKNDIFDSDGFPFYFEGENVWPSEFPESAEYKLASRRSGFSLDKLVNGFDEKIHKRLLKLGVISNESRIEKPEVGNFISNHGLMGYRLEYKNSDTEMSINWYKNTQDFVSEKYAKNLTVDKKYLVVGFSDTEKLLLFDLDDACPSNPFIYLFEEDENMGNMQISLMCAFSEMVKKSKASLDR